MQVKRLRKEETKTDMLSQLPKSLQLHILSSLDVRHAIATSLLSKSWASIWTGIPVLNFSSDGFKEDREFDNFVVNALSRRQPVKLDRLTYKCARCTPESLKEVFDYACLHGVEELEANITSRYKGHNWPIRSSDSLTNLKLQGSPLYVGCSFLGPKGPVGSFRNLSSLHLDCGTITDIDPFSGFPVLQKLRLIWCRVKTNGKTLNVHAPQLSEFTSYKTEVYRYEFTTPKLRYFEWEDHNDIPWLSKAHFPVLDTAIINHTGCTYYKEKIHYDYLLMMFNSLQGAKSLTVSAKSLHLLSLFMMNSCSPFRDLKGLKLDLRICGYTPFFIETLKLLPIMGDYFLDKSLDAKCTVVTYPNVKSSCVSFQEITITNEKGRLSQEEIERMVREAEEFAERIDARNALEDYMYNMKNQVSDKDKLADKLESDEKDKIEAATKEALEWLDDNQSAEKQEYDEKLKEVEAVCNLIITAVYQRTGGPAPESAEEEDEHDEL